MSYAFNYVHKIQEHIDYMYHWMSRLTYLVGLQFTLQNANASVYWENLNKKGLVYTK